MRSIQGLSFDLDETLLDGSSFSASIGQTCKYVCEQRPHLEPERLLQANHAVFSSLEPTTIVDWTLGRKSGRELSYEVWRRALAECGDKDPSLARLATSTHLELACSSYRLFEDAAHLLPAIQEMGIPVALVTNGASDTQRAKLQATGVLERFDPIVISGEIGVAKPNARAFQPVLSAFGSPAGEIWHVGDSLSTDVSGALDVGFTSVWLNRRSTPHDGNIRPDIEIASLTDLLSLITEGGAA